MAREIKVTADKIYNRKKRYTKLKTFLGLIFLLLIFCFIILSIIYKGGKFTVTLDRNLALDNNIVIYDDSVEKSGKRKLEASNLDFMDNISINWIPSDIDNDNGSHNGDNYIAYTYYIENIGKDVVNYWTELYIDDVIKNVDEALRVMIFENGEKTVYAKINSITNLPENGTTPFYSKDKVFVRERDLIKPNEIDKYTIVIWLEGPLISLAAVPFMREKLLKERLSVAKEAAKPELLGQVAKYTKELQRNVHGYIENRCNVIVQNTEFAYEKVLEDVREKINNKLQQNDMQTADIMKKVTSIDKTIADIKAKINLLQ